MSGGPHAIDVAWCGPEHAETVHLLTQVAFREQAGLQPPSGAGSETVEDVRDELVRHPGGLGTIGARPVACLRLVIEPGSAHVRRLAVLPELRRRGVGRAMMAWAESAAARRGVTEGPSGVLPLLPGST